MALYEGGAVENNSVPSMAPNEMSWRRQLASSGVYSHQQILVGSARQALPLLALDEEETACDFTSEMRDCGGEGRDDGLYGGLDCLEGLSQEWVSEAGFASPQVSEGDVVIPPCTPDAALIKHCWLTPPQNMSPPPAKLRRRAGMADVSYHQKPTCPSPHACPILELHVPTRSASLASSHKTAATCPRSATCQLGRKRGLLKRLRSEEEVGCPDRSAFPALPLLTPYPRAEIDGQCCPPRQQADQDSNADISCPNRDCDWRGHSEFLTCHIEEVCTSALVPCVFAASGCPARVPRGKMGAHLTAEMGHHLMLVARDNNELRGQLRALGDEQTALLTRVGNLETLATVDHMEDVADDATSICSST